MSNEKCGGVCAMLDVYLCVCVCVCGGDGVVLLVCVRVCHS